MTMISFNDSVFNFQPPNVEIYEHPIYDDAGALRERKNGSWMPIPVNPGEYVAFTAKAGQSNITLPDTWRSQGYKVTQSDGRVGFEGVGGYNRDKTDTVKIPYLAQVTMCTRDTRECPMTGKDRAKGSVSTGPNYVQLKNAGMDEDDFWGTYMDKNEWKNNLLSCCVENKQNTYGCKLKNEGALTTNQCESEIEKLCAIEQNKSHPLCGCYNIPPEKVKAVKDMTKFDIDPRFWYAPCASNSAFYTERRKVATLPNLQICNNIQNVSGNLDLKVLDSKEVNALTQSCNISSSAGSTTATPASAPGAAPGAAPMPTPTPTPTPTPASNVMNSMTKKLGVDPKYNLYIIGGVIIGFLLLIFAIGAMAGGGRHSDVFEHSGFGMDTDSDVGHLEFL